MRKIKNIENLEGYNFLQNKIYEVLFFAGRYFYVYDETGKSLQLNKKTIKSFEVII